MKNSRSNRKLIKLKLDSNSVTDGNDDRHILLQCRFVKVIVTQHLLFEIKSKSLIIYFSIIQYYKEILPIHEFYYLENSIDISNPLEHKFVNLLKFKF